ncbi:MAG TPA: glycosyltransferase [Opitutaceae bacterium]|jgi:glycosyltransferase involved in cell wall biosynthesis|nr:glycosyltransferase [Opitutaceae bacterium]
MSAPSPRLSVVICTHNPRKDFLARTLASLRAQTLPFTEWELIVIDNASHEPLAPDAAGTGHPAAKVVLESEVGLTAARLRGISEARANLLVFVDDDNLLAPDYLACVRELSGAWPQLGVWGCGSYTPEWEVAPPAGYDEYIRYLAVHRAPRDYTSNRPFDYEAMPAGAGLCVRATIAQRYADMVRNDPRRKLLGRTGGNLAGCEDFDLALTATDLGLGTGVFTALAITHLMPRGRVEEDYLLRLIEGHTYSTVLLMALRDPTLKPKPRSWLDWLHRQRLRRCLSPVQRRIHDACDRGSIRAWDLLRSIKPAHPKSAASIPS